MIKDINIEMPDQKLKDAIKSKIDLKTKPLGSLGVLETTAQKICTIQNTLSPEISCPAILVCAADHGIVEEGVSPYPQDVTWQMVMNFIGGGAAINVFARQHNLQLLVADAGVKYDFAPSAPILHQKVRKGTRNFAVEPAMTSEECNMAMQHGADIINDLSAKGCNTVIFGEMGIGNTTSATALFCKYSTTEPRKATGAGTGLDQKGIEHKSNVIARSLAKYGHISDPFEILCTLGGLEIAMIAGAMLQAAHNRMLILVDGFIVTSALMAAHAINPNILEYCIFTHQSDEQGHKLMLDYLGARPILNLSMRLGEGTGAAVAYPLIVSAVKFVNEMSSFEEAGVDQQQ